MDLYNLPPSKLGYALGLTSKAGYVLILTSKAKTVFNFEMLLVQARSMSTKNIPSRRFEENEVWHTFLLVWL